CNECCESPPERGASIARDEQENQCGDGSEGFRTSRHCKPGIVNSLYSPICVLIKTQLPWEFKGVRPSHTHGDGNEKNSNDFKYEQHNQSPQISQVGTNGDYYFIAMVSPHTRFSICEKSVSRASALHSTISMKLSSRSSPSSQMRGPRSIGTRTTSSP